MVLTGKRIILRALEREDLKAMHEWQNNAEIMRLARGVPDHMISLEALAAEYEKELKGEMTERQSFVVEERATKRLIGWASMRFWGRKPTSADLGLVISEKRLWRRGYGTEIAQLLLQEVFEQMNLHRAEWWTNSVNIGSLKLAKKMGFKEEGRLRDAMFFDNSFHDAIALGLLKDEYDKRRSKR